MIIACPACTTRYVVPDSAIGVDGRTVRCAKCRHSWFQDGEPVELPPERQVAAAEPSPAVPSPAGAPPPETRNPGTDPAEHQPEEETRPAPFGEQPSDAPPIADPVTPPPEADTAYQETPTQYGYDDQVSHFDAAPPFRARRNPLKLWTASAAIFAAIALGTIGAVSYWGLPDWVPISRPTFAAENPDLVLDFPGDKQDRRTLPNGTEFFGASGTVTNVGRESRNLPSILIVLRDGRERIVYSWEVAPPQASLAPGETVTINEAVTDVPRSAKFADIGWKPS
ncbi:MJ0042-type zinc finger domain-containing protein [Altererythrobacter aquiaggeris]|uniref:MJ0042-type zinc finger domain-containing protein n=1 Tax=Aestuarierythrobacter aquiaggeris TaxID=1898396 RepID=UPI0030163A45